MKKQWFSTVMWRIHGIDDQTESVNRLVAWMNKHNLQPGEVIILPLTIEGEALNPIQPVLYFAEKMLPSEGIYV